MKKPISKIDISITITLMCLFLFFSLKAYGPFEALERFFYSAEMRLDLPTMSLENKIAIVNIDSKSLQQLGPWPWPRHVIADMIRILKNNGAKLIGLDLPLPYKSQNEGLEAVRGLYNLIYRLQQQDQNNASYDILLKRVAEIENQPGISSCRLSDHLEDTIRNWSCLLTSRWQRALSAAPTSRKASTSISPSIDSLPPSRNS